MESGVVSEATLNKCCQDSYVKNYTLHTTPSKLKCAFTLAEVLITLGVIGVVAALTMPTLIAKYQKQATVTQLKKTYSEMAQAIQKAEAEYGTLETWDFANFPNSAERVKYFGEHYLFPNIKTVERCIPTSNKCWADGVENLSGNVITDSTYFNNTDVADISFTAASGYSVYFWLNSTGEGMWYVVDVNGFKKPNRLGKDIFAFRVHWGNVHKVGYYPAGLPGNPLATRAYLLNDTDFACKKEENNKFWGNGAYCTAVIALDGWKISDDYPW